LNVVTGQTSGGTPVTITGTGFLIGATVTFGANSAVSVVVVSSTRITCITPVGTPSAVVNVTVTNTDSQVGTLTGGFTYFASPAFYQGAAGTSGTIAYSSNNQQGSLLCACIRLYNPSATTWTINDTNNNNWVVSQQIVQTVVGNQLLAIFYAVNAVAGANTVTFSPASGTILQSAIGEWTGVATINAVDGSSPTATQGITTPATGPTQVTNGNPDLVIAFAMQTSSSVTLTTGGGFTLRVDGAPLTSVISIADAVGNSGSYTPVFTYDFNCNWVIGTIAFFG
jgi:hypothetical protein